LLIVLGAVLRVSAAVIVAVTVVARVVTGAVTAVNGREHEAVARADRAGRRQPGASTAAAAQQARAAAAIVSGNVSEHIEPKNHDVFAFGEAGGQLMPWQRPV
jgi:hypothetical protein